MCVCVCRCVCMRLGFCTSVRLCVCWCVCMRVGFCTSAPLCVCRCVMYAIRILYKCAFVCLSVCMDASDFVQERLCVFVGVFV